MAKVYCGTYGKYAAGSLAGKWFDLEDYSDKDDFIEACQEFHDNGSEDEQEHEFMFQDHEGIPDGMVSESSISDEVWEWLALDEYQQKTVEVCRDNVDQNCSIDYILEKFRGTAESPGDYCLELEDECGGLSNIPRHLVYHIDWDSVARDSELNFVEVSYKDFYVFDN